MKLLERLRVECWRGMTTNIYEEPCAYFGVRWLGFEVLVMLPPRSES